MPELTTDDAVRIYKAAVLEEGDPIGTDESGHLYEEVRLEIEQNPDVTDWSIPAEIPELDD